MAVQGYEDIDRLVDRQGQMLDKSLQQQNDIVNRQTQMQVDSLGRQKEQIDREAIQQNRALYQDYRKASNPFGTQAENLAGQGLANSGYAETTQARLYNTYQNNITATLNNARQLKNDVDFQIQQARQTGDITLAQNALQIFNQRMQLLSQEYDLRNNREQLLYNRQYQTNRDAISDRRWQTEWDYNKAQDKKNFDYQKFIDARNFKYQKERDKVADTQWQKEYELSKKARASSSRRRSSSSTSRKKSSDDLALNTSNNSIRTDDNTKKQKNDNNENVKKIFNTVDSLLKKTKTGRGLQEVAKETARQFLARSAETETISYEKAGKIYKKLGLEN